MLVLSRKLNESIQIGDDIEVKVVGIEGDQIKLGINAPRNVDIHRKEVYVAIQSENSEAANSSVDLLKTLTESMKKES